MSNESSTHSHGDYVFTINGVRRTTNDPVQQGRQLLFASGFDPVDEHALIRRVDRETRSVGLDESVDLREGSEAIFDAFRTDRTYRFTLNERGCDWGAATISELVLREIAQIGDGEVLLLEREDQPDRVLGPDDKIDLARAGTEHIRTRAAFVTIIVEATPHKWPKGEKISYAQVVTLEFPDFPQHPERTYSVTYRKGEGQHHEGILAPGDSVKVKDGMEFNVTDTGQS